MSSKPPPVPPANKSQKGTSADPPPGQSDLPAKAEPENVEQQGRSANTKQNTRHQGSHGSRDRGGD